MFVMVYGLAISGYVTAVLAVFLLGLREDRPEREDVMALRAEIAALRDELRESRAQPAETHDAHLAARR